MDKDFKELLKRGAEKRRALAETAEVEKEFNRPEVTQRVIDGFAAILDSQDKKGIEKYNRTIDDAEDKDYDWRLMALEEAADLQKYNVKEIMRLEGLVKEWKAIAHKKRGEIKCKNGEILELKESVKAHEEVGQGYHQEIVKLKQEIEMLKQEREQFKAEAAMWHKQSKMRLDEMRELQWRNIDLQNEVAALKEEPDQVITQEAFEKVLLSRDTWKDKYYKLMDKIKGLSEDA
jgi:cell division protein FtsB